MPAHRRSGFSGRVRLLVPPLAGWRTFPQAFGTLLIFGLAAIGAEWVVHQLAYLLEYRSQFGSVMATTPHRYYMGQSGVLFAVTITALLTSAAITLHVQRRRRGILLRRLPPRVHRLVPAMSAATPLRDMAATGLLLLALQVALYVVQENLEVLWAGGSWQGMAVLVGQAHWAVMPLHLLLAMCASVLLWTLTALLHSSDDATRLVEALARLLVKPSAPHSMQAPISHVPALEPGARPRSLRSPPLAA